MHKMCYLWTCFIRDNSSNSWAVLLFLVLNLKNNTFSNIIYLEEEIL